MANGIYNRDNYEELKKQVIKTNKAISRIEKQYGENSWGINNLYNKLNNDVFKGVTKSGKIRLNKSMSDIQLKAIEKATISFLNNKKTSTLTGIKGVIKDVKSSLKATYGDMGNRLTNKEVNMLYNLVEDKDKRSITEQIGASEVWATIIQAKEQKLDYNNFEDLINRRSSANINDLDAKAFLEDIYNRYIS
ncbi:MAG: hypothetical protein J6T10_21925 [Methanobrevibacter sp.]|nr:hypothetical protein [Methanobrevibacter sp.]